MNRKQHSLVAFILFFVIYSLSGDYRFYSVGVFVGAMIPDRIEPAKHYTHWGFFHSWRFLKLLIYFLLVSIPFALFFPVVSFFSFFSAGYISHLLIDSMTKMGLPK